MLTRDNFLAALDADDDDFPTITEDEASACVDAWPYLAGCPIHGTLTDPCPDCARCEPTPRTVAQ